MRLTALLFPALLAALPAWADGTLPHRDDLNAKDRARVAAVTAPPQDFSAPQRFEGMTAGAATDRGLPGPNAFSQPLANLSFEEEQRFKLGNGLFKKLWVAAPASTRASDGLGPLYNARSCQRCHLKDGRGHPPATAEDDARSLLIRLSIPPESVTDWEDLESLRRMTLPEPTYGSQLQDVAVPGHPAEGRIAIAWSEETVALNGGETASLRRPDIVISDLGYGPLHPETRMSARIAPPMIGLGLLEAIHEGDILAMADPQDRDGDGISGRAQWLHDLDGRLALGRFGWKAGTATVAEQSAMAFSGDMGIATPPLPEPWGECTAAQSDCRGAAHGVQADLGESEAPPPVLDLVAFYSSNLAPPRRRGEDDPQVLAGKQLFHAAGCAACHRPAYVTRRDAPQAAHAFQLIWPYSDLLLHDMGEGLADDRPAGLASGREWRTPPLWGIGLTETVSGHSFFLHDGRARSLLEAILWHGGEAQAARDAVVAMTPEERDALLAFLNSL